MIKYTELRCGNKVHISGKEYPNERLVATVGEIHYFGSTLECDFGEGEGEEDCDIDHEDLIPIPLSEEWLIRAGFEKEKRDRFFSLYLSDKDENEFGRQRIDYWFGEDDFSAAELCRSGVCFKRVKIKFVHQLQNLYFALTGEELTFKDL